MSHHLVILQDLSVFGQVREFNGDVLRITTLASFKSSMVTLTSAVPPGLWYCFGFTIFLGRNSSNGLYFAFAIITALTPQVREPM